MINNINNVYLNNSQKFWNTNNINKAKFEKVLVNKKMKKLESIQEKENYWNDLTKKHIDLILEGIPYKPEWRILEIGCGVGRLLKEFSNKFSSIYGVDFSEQMIKYAKENLKDKSNCSITQNNGYDLTIFSGDFFDYVYSIITFQHIRSYQIINNYVSEVYRVLKKNGIFRFQTRIYMENGTYGNPKSEPNNNKEYKFSGNGFTKTALKKLVKDNNLVLLTIKEKDNSYWVTCKKENKKLWKQN